MKTRCQHSLSPSRLFAVLAAGLSLTICSIPATAAETVCIAWGETFQLPADKLLTFKHCAHDIDDSEYANIIIIATNPTGDTVFFSNNPEELMPSVKLSGSNENISACPPCPMVLCGPAAIFANITGSTGETVNFFQLVVTVEDLNTSAADTPTTIPTGVVVIPSDAAGSVEIKLQSSEDMINWNSALPGLYAPTESSRFFRVTATTVSE